MINITYDDMVTINFKLLANKSITGKIFITCNT